MAATQERVYAGLPPFAPWPLGELFRQKAPLWCKTANASEDPRASNAFQKDAELRSSETLQRPTRPVGEHPWSPFVHPFG